jgi:hypothetical protein
MGCSSCGNNGAQGKLGRCSFCIGTNLLGAIIGWVSFIIFLFFYPVEKAAGVALMVSTFFTLFFIAHLLAYYKLNKKTKRNDSHADWIL